MPIDALVGQQLGQFRLERLLAGGKTTSAYRGYDLRLQRPVCIKVIDLHTYTEPDNIRRFIETARAVITWQHENVAQVYEVVAEDDLCFIVTEQVSGLALSELLKQYRADDELMPHADVLRIGGAIVNALDYAHQRNVLHGAVWPTNVLIGSNNRIVLQDFELGMPLVGERSLRDGKRMPQYSAPEQARNIAAAVPQSDIYSLGVILYEMLTGSLPFDDPSPTAVTLRHIMTEPPSPRSINPNLNAETEAVLLIALSKDPADRYPNGHELICALEKALLPGADQPAMSELSSMLAAIAAPALSATSVAEKLRLYEEQTASPLPHLTRKLARRAEQRNLLPRVVRIMTGIVMVGGLIAITSLGWTENNREPVEAAASVATAAPTATPTVPLTASPIPPTHTPTVLAASSTASPSSGRQFDFYYDNSGFEMVNASGASSALAEFAFERLDASMSPTNRMDGRRFAGYAPRGQIFAGWCVRLKIVGAAATNTSRAPCQGTNSEMLLAESDPGNFWTAQVGSTWFRVLWNGAEVARCAISEGMCEAFLP